MKPRHRSRFVPDLNRFVVPHRCNKPQAIGDRMLFSISSLVRSAFFCLCLLWSGATLLSQSRPAASPFTTKHEEARAQNPADLGVTLALVGGKRRFRQGEIIPLELSFTSRLPNQFFANTASYDRSGRLHKDTFHLSPEEGFSDPLYEYFHDGGLMMMGGLSSNRALSASPFTIPYRLNEWLRFDKPGTYKLYVTSPRIGRKKNKEDRWGEPLAARVASNLVEFEILPANADWAKTELAKAVRILDDPKQREKHAEAACVLRYLDTEEAAAEMIKRLDDTTSDFSFGLIGSSQRNFVVETMEKRIELPEQAVSSRYLHWLTWLTQRQQFPARPPARTPLSEEEAKAYYSARQQAFERVSQHYASRLAGTITQKKGTARAISITTLIGLVTMQATVPGNQPTWFAQTVAEIPAIYDDLSYDLQQRLLGWYWQQIASPVLLPLLKKIHADEKGHHELRSLALRRLYELAPATGRTLILAELRKATEINSTTLTLLPDETLPEVDDALATLLENPANNLERTAALIERYATAAITPRVRAVYGEKGGQWACSLQASLLAYFLRVDAAMGAELVQEALSRREHTGCYNSLLEDVGKLHFNAELEQIALKALEDETPAVTAAAIRALGKYGSAQAEQPLWQRFKQWHQQWQGRAPQLTARPSSDEADHQRLLESSLQQALCLGSAWLTDANALSRVSALCLTPSCRDEINRHASRWKAEIDLEFRLNSEGWGEAFVAQYSVQSLEKLKEKIAQFPPGTTFKWVSDPEKHEQVKAVFLTIKTFIEEKGLRLKQ